MASSLIAAWQIEWERVGGVTDFLFLGSKITVDGDCSHEIRRWLLLGRKAMTNLDSVLKSRDIILPTKVCVVKAIVFSVKVKVKSLSHVQLFATPWTVAHQAPPSMDSPGKNTGVGCHFLLQGIFLTMDWTQGSNPGPPHCEQML